MRKTILIMDDDEKFLCALAIRLEHAGYEVLTAPDGLNGLHTALDQQPHLILADVLMPHYCGLSVRQKLHNLKQDHIPVVLMTTDWLPRMRADAARAGAAALWDKLCDFERLRMVLDSLLRQGPAPVPSSALMPVQVKPPVGASTILIVEDDARVARSLEIRLRAAGYVSLTTADGAEGLKLAHAHRPELIVMDIWTPVGTGIAAARHLVELGLAEIPIIFMGASKSDALHRQAMAAGGVAYFEKPLDPDALVQAIDQTLLGYRCRALAA